MKRLISLFLLTLGIILPILAQQKEIDVYLVGGQSNATRQAYVKNIPASFKIDTRVRIYYSRFLNKGEGSEQWNPLCQASETKNKFGIELSLGTIFISQASNCIDKTRFIWFQSISTMESGKPSEKYSWRRIYKFYKDCKRCYHQFEATRISPYY